MMKKKLLCMLLSVAMVFTVMDTPASASEVQTTNETAGYEASTSQENTIPENTPEQTESESYGEIQSSEAQSETDSEAKTETTAESKPDPETESETELKPEVKTELETETELELNTELESESELKTELESELESESETKTLAEVSTDPESETESADTALQAAYHTADEIREFAAQEKAAKTDKITYKTEPDLNEPYSAGALSEDTLRSAASMLRQIRFIAGLPYDVALNGNYNNLSQSAALVNYVNHKLSPEPSQPDGMSETLFEQGCEGASNSNIAFDSNQKKTLNEMLIDSWMADKDSETISKLENRSRILNASMAKAGFGAVSGSKGIYSAMYTADCSGETENIFGIAWPAQNMPVEYFGNDYPWSVSTNETLEASDIDVTLTRESDGKEWNFSTDSADGDFYVYSDPSAQKSNIIFRPEASGLAAYEDKDSFQIEINKNKKTYINYTVHFFSLTEKKEMLTAPKASITKESKLILTSEEKAAIYYTLDGTTPSADSTLYVEPIAVNEDITVKAIAVKEGCTDSDIAEFIYTVVEDVPSQYIITFESNGGTIVPAQSILENEKIEQPETPVKEGYLLEGWFKEAQYETIWDFEKDTVTSDITLYAKWAQDPSAAMYTVNFALQEHGTPIESLTVKTGELLTTPEAPTAEGYQFEGWFKEPECTNAWDFAVDTILSDTILYAKWTQGKAETNTHVITFDLQGIGTPIEPVTVNHGETFAAPEVPAAEGYTFAEWYRETKCINAWNFEADVVTEDIVLYAKWISDDAEISMSAAQGAREEDTRIDLGAASSELKTNNIKPRRYNGKPYEPSITVSIFNGKKRVTLKKDRDYTLAYRNNVNAGTASAIITGIENYKGRKTVTFIIEPPINLTDDATQTIVTDNIKPRRYNGTPYEPRVTVSIFNGKKRITLKKDRDYTVTYKDNINASTNEKKASVTITGTAEYTGSITRNFIIEPPIDLTDTATQTLVKDIKPRVYNGKEYEPNVNVSIYNGKKRVTLKKDRDYTLKLENNVNASTDTTQASVTITGKGEYTGSLSEIFFTITPKSIKKLNIITESKLTNSGNPAFTVYDGSMRINNNNFISEYTDTDDPKKAKLTLTAKPNTNYTGSVTVKLTVYDVEKEYYINSAKKEITGDTTYTGKAISRNVKLTIGDTELQNNKDYKVQYQNNTNAGTAVMIITGKGKYKGKIVGTFNIGKVDINNTEETDKHKQHVTIAEISPKTFNGNAQTPAVTIKTIQNKKLALNKDYTVAYSNNLHSGTALITIKGIGNNCNGSTSIKFEIEPQEIKKASVKVTKATDKEPSRIVLTYNKKELLEYADYAITNHEELHNKQVSVTIQGIGDFKGEVTKKLTTEIPEDNWDSSSAAISTNINGHNYSDFEGSDIRSYLFQNDDNTFVRVEYIGNNNICIESYTPDYKFISQKIIKMELPKFGGFYAGKDYYFLAFGQRNPNKDDTLEVLRIIKYDKNWNRIDATRLFGANTLDPFKNGSLRMIECEDTLYIRTCHQMYNAHQANISLCIQISTMDIKQQLTGVYNLGWNGYVSHSYNQYVLLDDDNTLLTVDHGDAYPRSVVMVRYNKKAPDASAFGGNRAVSVLPMGGSGAHTGVSVGAFEASDTAYLTAGNSVDQKANPYSTGTIRNIFVTSTQKDNFSADGTTEHWITNYKYIEYTDAKGNPQKTPEAVVTTPHLVKLNGNELMLLWTESINVIEDNKPVPSTIQKSMLLNGNGEPISGIYSFDGPLSDCKPIVVNGNILWYYTNNSAPVFYTLNPEDVRKVPR